MSANDLQVGGRHYAGEYQHWDFCLRVGLDYLSGNATKYIARNRKKGGRDDLLKALHYIDKLAENSLLVARTQTRPALTWIRYEVSTFCAKNDLNPLEKNLIMWLATWTTEQDLRLARQALREHLDDTVPEPKPVPVSDSNKHADRTEGHA